MPSPRFPAAGMVLENRVIPLDKFDPLFAKITQERQILDGYFLQVHPDEARLLFVVNGAPYAAASAGEEGSRFLEIHEFFAAYAQRPQSPLSFFAGDKRLLLGLMVLFRHAPSQERMGDATELEAVLGELAARGVDAILGIRARDEWGVGICTKGKLAAAYLPYAGPEAPQGAAPAEQLKGYAAAQVGVVQIRVFEETRVGPAEDVSLVTPETRGRLCEVFLRVAARLAEPEPAPAQTPLPPGPEAEPEPLLELLPPEREPEPVLELLPPEAEPEPLLGSLPSEPEPEPVLELLPSEPEPALEALSGSPPPAAPPSVEATLTTGTSLPGVPAPPAAPAAPPAFKGPVPEVVLYLGERQVATYSLAGGELSIGRTAGNSILIENPGVSRRHAVVRVVGEQVVLEDLGSANGTFVNGQKVASQALKDGDEIQIVKHRMVFRVPKEPEPAKKAAPALDAGKTMMLDPSLMGQAMGGKAPAPRPETATPVLRPRLILPDLKKYALEKEEVAIGSSAECQIQIPGMFVAKVHARILPQEKAQYKLVHLGGLAGTRVNGERVSEHVLKHGDEIEIGGKKILFRLER